MNAAHDFTGNFFTLLNPYAVLAGVATLGLFTLHGAYFLGLKADGHVRERANHLSRLIAPVVVLVGAGFLVWTEISYGRWVSAVIAVAAAVTLIGGVLAGRRGREGWAFGWNGVAIVAVVAALFVALYPDVLPSTTDPAGTLTIANASSTHYTLVVMTWVAGIFTPIVLLYQSWTYWVFRKRITRNAIPVPPQPKSPGIETVHGDHAAGQSPA